jgi:isopenicillin N synthase-like dioxygenase
MPTSSFPFPIVDLADASPTARQRLCAQLDEACTNVGFFVLAGHGVPAAIVANAWTAAATFFDCPPAIKAEVPMSAEYPYGYSSLGAENLAKGAGGEGSADPKESFCVGPDNPHAGVPTNLWPTRPVDLRPAWTAYYSAMVELSRRLLSLFANCFGLPDDWFADKTDHHASALRALHYPALEAAPAGFVRAGAHTDYGTLTILRSGGPGLQIATRSGGWADVPELDDTFIVNLGDLMARWTNDRWTSTSHRVVASTAGRQARRQSIAFFHNPNLDLLVTALPGSITETRPAKYPPITAGDHLMAKHKQSTGSY